MTHMMLLRGLLGSKRLTSGQERAFKGMLQDLVDGKSVGLSKNQREWAEGLFSGLNLSENTMKLAPLPQARKQVGAPPTVFEMPKPLKPPGKS